jgi:hypothetical protein
MAWSLLHSLGLPQMPRHPSTLVWLVCFVRSSLLVNTDEFRVGVRISVSGVPTVSIFYPIHSVPQGYRVQ